MTMNQAHLPHVGLIEGRAPTLEEYQLSAALLRRAHQLSAAEKIEGVLRKLSWSPAALLAMKARNQPQ